MSKRWKAIPDLTEDPRSMHNAVHAIKENVEIMTGQRRGDPLDRVVTWGDLMRLQLINQADLPKD